MAWIERTSPPSLLLCVLSWSWPFTQSYSPVELYKGLVEISHKIWPPHPICSTLWTGFGLTFLHTVILWCTMRCPMIFSMIGRPRAMASGVCLLRENKRRLWFVGSPLIIANLMSGPFHGWSVDHGWVCTGELAEVCQVLWKWSAWQCGELLCAYQLQCKVLGGRTIALCFKACCNAEVAKQ